MSRDVANEELLQLLGRYLLGSNDLLVAVLDSRCRITFVNALAEQLIGLSVEELRGNTWESVFASGENAQGRADFSERIRSGKALQVPSIFEAKSGKREAVSWDFSAPQENGESRVVIAVGKLMRQEDAQDMHVREEWETLSGIVNNVGAGLNLLSRERRILWTNAQMQNWFGNGFLVGSFCYEVFHEHKHAVVDCPSFYTFQTKKTGTTSKWVTTSDGKNRFFQFITTPILNEVSEVTHILELIIDMTVRKETEDRRVESEKLATIGELAKAVAHEIRNPMTVIGGFTRRLRKKMPNSALVRETADVILKESRRLEDMVLKVNLFLNPKESNFRLGHINELLLQTLKVMSRDFEAAAVEVRTHLGQDIPAQMMDKNKFRQVIFNILQNALDAMPQGGELTVTSALKDDFVEARIQDTGPGIDEHDAGSIFHAFFTRKQTGLGLGLTIASQIVHEHGGYINVETGPKGSGATFTVALPIHHTGR